MSAATGIFVVVRVDGTLGEKIGAIQRSHDARLAKLWPPHVTIIGSSGCGPIVADTSVAELEAALRPVAARHAPLTVAFGAPQRFPDRDIVVLPLDPHGPLRALHEDLARSGLRAHRARYPFTPHCTLTMYPPLSRTRERDLLSIRLSDPLTIARLEVYLTRDPQPARLLLELSLGVTSPS
ncbi:MAG TPA: 2'-5' RNA ligase family protein [Gemmatimonadaceae bacterium]|nr:2'-5' RNA ligase family protein [Gemmatimonadaceae bacterium]